MLTQTVELSGEDAGRAVVVECDIRKPEDRERLMAVALEQPGTLYGLVNNAGIFRFRPLLDESVVDWRDTFETNVEATFFLSQLAIGVMRTQRQGRIINIASMHGMVGVSNLGRGTSLPESSEGDRGPFRGSAYATSKGALIQLTRDLAIAVGRWGITVNAVSPGSVPPKAGSSKRVQTKDAEREVLEALILQTPLGRLGTVEDIAGPVSFLLSDDAAYITGANIVVDGGFTAW
jgi:NAD(P)-dependent dehydrogenase (short-subunit alcohol dehydrogenase family)